MVTVLPKDMDFSPIKMIVVILMLCGCGQFVWAEPRCSRFDYEEKTLEKMIRTEIAVKQVLSDVEHIKKQTIDAVNSLERMKLELEDDLNLMIAENNQKFDEIRNTIREFKDQHQVKPNVLFLAKDPTTQSPGNGKTIVFGTTMWDSSGSYDKISGLFTVPVDGSYLFSTQLCLEPGSSKYIHYAIVAGGKQVANSLLYDSSARFCNTAHAAVTLSKGQTVYIHSISTSSTPLRVNHANEWCTFSGILIH